jgi:hypothetical protein
LQPYGRHRYLLEHAVRERFANALIVRLPGLFGPGLKKNVIYDLLGGDYSHTSAADSTLQFYDARRLWHDVERAQRRDLLILNAATEPLALSEIGRVCTGKDIESECRGPAVHDDMQTRHSGLRNRTGPYLYSKEEVISDLIAFVGGRTHHLGITAVGQP